MKKNALFLVLGAIVALLIAKPLVLTFILVLCVVSVVYHKEIWYTISSIINNTKRIG